MTRFLAIILLFLYGGCASPEDTDDFQAKLTNEMLSSQLKPVVIPRKQTTDVPLGSSTFTHALQDYEYYGEFLDDHVLDFYYQHHPDMKVYGVQPDFVLLYFIDGVLIKKKYTFEQDIANDVLENLNLKTKVGASFHNIKEFTVRFKNKYINYSRVQEFCLVEKPTPG